jgi:hypothetical protein
MHKDEEVTCLFKHVLLEGSEESRHHLQNPGTLNLSSNPLLQVHNDQELTGLFKQVIGEGSENPES